MTKLEEIERAVETLTPADLERFRAWFAEFDAARFDEKIERDAKSGRLDRLAEQAIGDFFAPSNLTVMPGLVPAIHVLLSSRNESAIRLHCHQSP